MEGLDIVPANIDLSAAEVQLVNEVAREQALKRVLRPVLDEYDVILVDCQPSLGLLHHQRSDRPPTASIIPAGD